MSIQRRILTILMMIMMMTMMILCPGEFPGVRSTATSKTGRTYPPQLQRSYNVLVFPIYVSQRHPLYDTIDTHLSLADHKVSYLIYEEDLNYSERVQLTSSQSKDIHLIRRRQRSTIDFAETNRTAAIESVEMAALSASNSTRVIDETTTRRYLEYLSNRCEWLLSDERLMAALRATSPDLILIELQGNDVCGLILARKLKIHAVGLSTTALAEPFIVYTGNPSSAKSAREIVAQYFLPSSSSNHETKWTRNYFHNLARIACDHLADTANRTLCPSVQELYRSLQLVFVNSDAVVEFSRPVMPNVVPIGGIVTKVPQLFPKDMESIARFHRAGIILITLETSLAIKDYPKRFVGVLADAVAKFEHAIFWKAANNGSVENPSANVFFEQAFSIQDVLGHARTRLVITLCDTDTVYSAIYHGVPILCIPMADDQFRLARMVEIRGYGRWLATADNDDGGSGFDEENLIRTINHIVTNKTYKENVRRSSRLLRDRPDTPSDRLIFWTEFVIRHDGLPYLFDPQPPPPPPFAVDILDVGYVVVVVVVVVLIFVTIGLLITTSSALKSWQQKQSKKSIGGNTVHKSTPTKKGGRKSKGE